MPIAFFDVDTQKRSVSAAGAPPIVFRFIGDTCEAELEGITLAAKLGPDGSIAVLVHTYQHEVFASFDLRPSQTMEPARSLMEVGSALIWSNWRRKHAFAASARAEEEKLGAPDGWDSPFSKRCVDADAAKLRELIADYLNMEGSSTGGSLHIVLDDGNHDRSSVAFCVRYAVKHRDWDGVALGTAILALDDIEYDKLLPPWDDVHEDDQPGPVVSATDLAALVDKYALAPSLSDLSAMDLGGGEQPADASQKRWDAAMAKPFAAPVFVPGKPQGEKPEAAAPAEPFPGLVETGVCANHACWIHKECRRAVRICGCFECKGVERAGIAIEDRASELLRQRLKEVVAAGSVLPSWCDGSTLAARIAHLVRVQEWTNKESSRKSEIIASSNDEIAMLQGKLATQGLRWTEPQVPAAALEDAARAASCLVSIVHLRDEVSAKSGGAPSTDLVISTLIEHLNAALVKLYGVARRG